MTYRWWVGALALAVALGGMQPGTQAQPKKAVPKPREKMIEDAVAFLKGRQEKDGSWSKASSPGVTAVVLTALLASGKEGADGPAAAAALKFIETMIDEKEGHIARGDKIRHVNYITSVNLIALKASGQDKYKAAIKKAAAFLKGIQWNEKTEKKKDDLEYGGVGYGAGTRPDLSNTRFFLDALQAAGVPRDDDVFKQAVIFVSRCQNLKGEHNTQPWAAKTNDGSFIYVLAAPKGKAGGTEEAARPGYGSMTAVGLKALADCDVAKDDARFTKALEWLNKNYSVDLNPGQAPGAGHRGYYVYMYWLAQALEALGIDEITTPDGKKHDWREDITAALRARQRRDGSWFNDSETWMEGNPDLCTAFAILALKHSAPKAK